MKKSRITAALLAFGISASMVFQTPVFATEETAVAVIIRYYNQLHQRMATGA